VIEMAETVNITESLENAHVHVEYTSEGTFYY